jgi:hypothetical protein
MKVVYDVYPAKALVTPQKREFDSYEFSTMTLTTEIRDSRLVNDVRVVITEHTVLIAADSSNGPMLIFREKYLPDTLLLDKKGTTRLITVNGKALAFRKDSGCGCGSMLRAWNPYKTLHSMKDPTQ